MENEAQELISAKEAFENAEYIYNTKRDAMYNALTRAGQDVFEFGGHRFQKTNEKTVITVTKQKLFEAMNELTLDAELQQRLFSLAYNESVRQSGIRITRTE